MIAIGLFGLGLIIQLYYYLFVYRRLAWYKETMPSPDVKPVSVIICARNESKNLRRYLSSVLEQIYPDFQVIVVNDCSWDESAEFLDELERQYSNLKVVSLIEQERYKTSKKFALSIGIKAADHEVLLLTDADCQPAGKNWISYMQGNIGGGKDIVIGYGPYMKKSGFLNRLIRFDSFFTAIQYLSHAIGGNPYMGVGRNLGYKKSLFFANKGFATHSHIISGDDDLFINQVANSQNTSVEINKESFTYSEPHTEYSKWIVQKKRHMLTGPHYKWKHKLSLGLGNLSAILFYVFGISLIILGFPWEIVLGAYVLRLLIQLIIFGRSMKKLGELDLIWISPLLDFYFTFFYPSIAISNIFVKVKKWK